MNIQKFNYFENIVNHININVLEHGLVDCDPCWNYKDHSSPFTRLYFIIEGEGLLENREHKVVLKPGYMYFIPVNSTYNYSCNNYMKQLYFHLRLELSLGQDIFDQLGSCASIPVDKELVCNLLHNLESSNLWDVLHIKFLLSEICSRFIPLIPAGLDTHINNALKYREVFRFVKESCSPELTIDEISKHVNLSPAYLAKAFKNDIGITLKSYVDKLILQYSKEKLLLSEMNIKEIAYHLKFCDEFYFSKFFKKHMGVSPREYRRINKF